MGRCGDVVGLVAVVGTAVVVAWALVPLAWGAARRWRRDVVSGAFRWRYYVVAGLFLGVFWLSYALLRGQGIGVHAALYEALRMFVMNADLELVDYGHDICVDRVLWGLRMAGPIMTATGVLGFIYDKLLTRPVLVARDHIVVAGLGKLGTALCEHLLAVSNRTIVGIERDGANPNVARLRARGVRVIVGDAGSRAVLRYARIQYAAKYLAVTDSDYVNVESTIEAVHAVGERRLSRLKERTAGLREHFADATWAMAHVASEEVRDSLGLMFPEESPVSVAAFAGLIDTFSSYRYVAKQLLEEQDWRHLVSERHLVVIAGIGDLGSEVMDLVLGETEKTPLWIVDPKLEGKGVADLVSEHLFHQIQAEIDAEMEVAGVRGQDLPLDAYRQVAERLNERVKLFAADVTSREFGAELLQTALDEGIEAISFFLCVDNDLKNMSFGERLVRVLEASGTRGKVSVITRRYRAADDVVGAEGVEVRQFDFMGEFLLGFFGGAGSFEQR